MGEEVQTKATATEAVDAEMKVTLDYHRFCNLFPPMSDTGPDADVNFIEALEDLENKLDRFIKINERMFMSDEDEISFQHATYCCKCNAAFATVAGQIKKNRDHCHMTGAYHSPACSRCNLQMSNRHTFMVPLFTHNAKGYDSKLALQGYDKYYSEKLINERPQ